MYQCAYWCVLRCSLVVSIKYLESVAAHTCQVSLIGAGKKEKYVPTPGRLITPEPKPANQLGILSCWWRQPDCYPARKTIQIIHEVTQPATYEEVTTQP